MFFENPFQHLGEFDDVHIPLFHEQGQGPHDIFNGFSDKGEDLREILPEKHDMPYTRNADQDVPGKPAQPVFPVKGGLGPLGHDR